MGLAALAAAGPVTPPRAPHRKGATATPCTVGLFLAALPPAERDALVLMLHPDSGWTGSAIAYALNSDPDYAPAPLVKVGIRLRAGEDGILRDATITRHRRALRNHIDPDGPQAADGCKCFQTGDDQ